MRRKLFTTLIILSVMAGGCHKQRTLGNFGLKAGLTEQDIEDQMGSPAKKSPIWVAYNMEDGSELRLYFLQGPVGPNRTLSEADLYTGEGQSLRITQVFKIKKGPTSAPATKPTAERAATAA